MIDFRNLDEIRFNMNNMTNDEARTSLTYAFDSFCKEHDGERWTSMLLCMMYSDMEIIANRYGYKLVSTRDNNTMYVKVVRNETL